MKPMILEKIENLAEKLLKEIGANSLPIPVEEVAGRYRIQIRRAKSKDFSGLLIRKDDYALIGINSSEAETRQRFTVAHELGHFFLHPKKDTFIDYRNNRRIVRTPREMEANMFAAALLMPRKILENDYKKMSFMGFGDEDLSELASRYHVSDDAMRFRLMNLRLK